MEKKITLEEEQRANRIKVEFAEVHDQISKIQEEMESLNKKAESLILSLEAIRKEESEFVEKLTEKYGDGFLDPFNMTYKIKTDE
jgi:DNA anti-recombination protein RmuC